MPKHRYLKDFNTLSMDEHTKLNELVNSTMDGDKELIGLEGLAHMMNNRSRMKSPDSELLDTLDRATGDFDAYMEILKEDYENGNYEALHAALNACFNQQIFRNNPKMPDWVLIEAMNHYSRLLPLLNPEGKVSEEMYRRAPADSWFRRRHRDEFDRSLLGTFARFKDKGYTDAKAYERTCEYYANLGYEIEPSSMKRTVKRIRRDIKANPTRYAWYRHIL